MNLTQILEALAQVQAQLVALQQSTAVYTQADLDAAVASAVAPLNEQVAAFPGQIEAAVGAEKARVLDSVKGKIDELVQLVAGL